MDRARGWFGGAQAWVRSTLADSSQGGDGSVHSAPASPEMRARHLGAGWERARVRGSQHNTGDGHRAAMEIGAGTSEIRRWLIGREIFGESA